MQKKMESGSPLKEYLEDDNEISLEIIREQ
jgi:hypothetical protein